MSLGIFPLGNRPLTTFASGTPAVLTIIRPVSDVSAGNWLPSSGSDLYATIDETTASDSDYDYTKVASTMQVKLNAVADPGMSTSHKIRYRIKGDRNITVYLKQNTTTIASWTHSPAPNSYTTYEQTLTAAEADSITDYSDLRVEILST